LKRLGCRPQSRCGVQFLLAGLLSGLLLFCASPPEGVLTPKGRETVTSADAKPGQLVNFGHILGNDGDGRAAFLEVEAINPAREFEVIDIWALDANQAGTGIGVVRGDLVQLAQGRIQSLPVTRIEIEPNEYRWYVIVSVSSRSIGTHGIEGLRIRYQHLNDELEQEFSFKMRVNVKDCNGQDRLADVCVRQGEANPFEQLDWGNDP
jgi:hypothetical protein